MDEFMIPSNNQNELIKFLKILSTRLREHEQAYEAFLKAIQKPIPEFYNRPAAIAPEREVNFTLKP